MAVTKDDVKHLAAGMEVTLDVRVEGVSRRMSGPMWEASDGSLWVGGTIVRFGDGQPSPVVERIVSSTLPAPVFPTGQVRLDPDGDVWQRADGEWRCPVEGAYVLDDEDVEGWPIMVPLREPGEEIVKDAVRVIEDATVHLGDWVANRPGYEAALARAETAATDLAAAGLLADGVVDAPVVDERSLEERAAAKGLIVADISGVPGRTLHEWATFPALAFASTPAMEALAEVAQAEQRRRDDFNDTF